MHVREELGVDPDEQPSPWTAAISSFLCFSIGALVPLLTVPARLHQPLAGARRRRGGALRGRGGRRPVHQPPWWTSGLRQLLLGAAAAGATYLIGALIGVQGGSADADPGAASVRR